ncbi:C2H2-type zinc finger protein [Lachnospiraceae bacterium ZAX-1]
MAFIANKPVRIGGRQFAIGAVVPDALIEPKMTERLIGWGKIVKVDLPESTPPEADPLEDNAENTDTQDKGEEEAPEPQFLCHICGKSCATKSALTAHQKTHDK